MGKYRSGSIRVDVSDVIDAICDDDLMDEVRDRRLVLASDNEPTDLEIVQEAYAALARGKSAEAMSILDRLLNPKWKSEKQCQDSYQATHGKGVS